MSQDHQHWLIAYYLDDAPLEYFHYDRGRRRARRLFSLTPALEGAPLVKMEPVAIRARDGLELISYLRRPRGSSPADRLPMVLLVHGGPCGRDVCAFEIHAAFTSLAHLHAGALLVQWPLRVDCGGLGKALESLTKNFDCKLVVLEEAVSGWGSTFPGFRCMKWD